MKRLGVSLALLSVLALALVPEQRQHLTLVKIEGTGAAVLAVLRVMEIDVAQELATGYLARVDPQDIADLAVRGVRVRRIDAGAGRGDYVLTPARSEADLAPLRLFGRAALVEPGTAVFWSEAGNTLAFLPLEFPRKPLPAQSILAHLRAPAAGPAVLVRSAPLVDEFVRALTDQVSGDSLETSVQALQDFRTRFALTEGCVAAGRFLYDYFLSLGLAVRYEPFTFGQYYSLNVIAEKRGETEPDEIVVICAHYDSITPPASRDTLAPGADDNASGVAAVMEAARILAEQPLDFTVRFAAFSAEELGLFGSIDHAGRARQAGERIVAVLNLDMIAYADAAPEDLEIIVDDRSAWLGERLAMAATGYAAQPSETTVNASFKYSDHSPFWDLGYPAVLAIEDEPLTNPHYHRVTDTVDTLDPSFFRASTQAALGLLAELAQPLIPWRPRTPKGLDAQVSVFTSLFNVVADVRLSWEPVAGAVGYNVYRSPVSHLEYERMHGEPVTDTVFYDRGLLAGETFYYVVRSINDRQVESFSSIEREVQVMSAAPAPPQRRGLAFGIGSAR